MVFFLFVLTLLCWTCKPHGEFILHQQIKTPTAMNTLVLEGATVETIVIGNTAFHIVSPNEEYKLDASLHKKLTSQIQQLPEYYHFSHNEMAYASNLTWNIERIFQPSLPLVELSQRPTNFTGKGVDVYVIDTGANVSHPEFEGRVKWGINFADSINEDCAGHGTHVTGTVLSRDYGVAPEAEGIVVKVLNCNATGPWSGVIKGIGWAVNQALKSGRPSVFQMSIEGALFEAVNLAVEEAYSLGIVTVVAAGNYAADACNTSPASARHAITVASMGPTDILSPFSNYGECVDVLAPGERILSTWYNGSEVIKSGTSMAAPHVTGVLAQIFGVYGNYTPLEATLYLLNMTVKSNISPGNSTPNRILQGLTNENIRNLLPACRDSSTEPNIVLGCILELQEQVQLENKSSYTAELLQSQIENNMASKININLRTREYFLLFLVFLLLY